MCGLCEKLCRVCKLNEATKGSHCDDCHKKRQDQFVSRDLFDKNCKSQLAKFDEMKKQNLELKGLLMEIKNQKGE